MRHTISREIFDEILAANDIKGSATYSGRGMYGRTCVGIVGSGYGAAYKFLRGLADYDETGLGEEDVTELADSMATDSMGYDKIFYWSGLTVDEPADEDEDEGEDDEDDEDD